jgi:hypothetical protein
LLAGLTDSYAAFWKQQSVQMFPGVASGKSHLPTIRQPYLVISGHIYSYLFISGSHAPHGNQIIKAPSFCSRRGLGVVPFSKHAIINPSPFSLFHGECPSYPTTLKDIGEMRL